jgi:glycosyltransferase involved in cell wall biosynthesis
MTGNRPLRLAVTASVATGSGGLDGLLSLLARTERVDFEMLPARHIGSTVRALRRSRPDFVLASGARAARIAVPAARLAGVRVGLWGPSLDGHAHGPLTRHADAVLRVDDSVDPHTAADELASALASAAARPGAGITGGPPVSVIATVLRERAAIDGLLDRVLPQLRDHDEFIVVDGGSDDGTLERLEVRSAQDARLRPISAPGTNISQGRNVAIGVASHSVVACTDAGCEPVSGWLEALRAPFGERDAPSLVTGVYRVRAKRAVEDAQVVACHPDPDEARHPGPLVLAYGRFLGRVWTPIRPLGRSMAVSVEAWRAVGGFPEDLLMAEDITFGLSVARTGRRCVLSVDAEVIWDPRPSLRSTARMYHNYGVWDGRSGSRALVGPDFVRAVAYFCGPVLLWRGGRLLRSSVIAGATGYLSLPMVRALRRPHPGAVGALVPLALAVMDISKATGCARGLLARDSRTRQAKEDSGR